MYTKILSENCAEMSIDRFGFCLWENQRGVGF